MGNTLLLPHCRLANHARVQSKRSSRDQSSPWIPVTVLARSGAHFSRCGADKIWPQARNTLDTAVNWGLSRGWLVALLLPPAMACLWSGTPGGWLPDGERLLPSLRVLVFYFLFFSSGWLIHRSPGELESLRRNTLPFLGVGLVGLGVVLALRIGLLSGQINESLSIRLAVFAADTACAWFLSLGLTGAGLSLVKNQNPTIRYIADASYWIYLIHLPVMLLIQQEVHAWHIPIAIKFLATLATTTAIGFESYALFVRHTPIGTLLNGPRKR